MPDAPSRLESGEVLDLLASLVQKSLVLYEEDEQGRGHYRLLEPMRQYAREKLVEAGEREDVSQRHLAAYLSLAEEAATQIYRAGQAAWQQRLESEHDNLRAALEWSLSSEGDDEAALRLVGALEHFWVMGSHLREGREWVTRALAGGRPPACGYQPLVLAGALECGHTFAFWKGDYAAAAALAAEALRWAREAGNRWQIGRILFAVAIDAVHCGEFETARASAEEGIALAQAEGDRWLMGRHRVIFGLIAWMQGDFAAARPCFREALEISRSLEDEWHVGMCLALLGCVSRREGDGEEARALHQEGLRLFARLRDRRGIAWHLVGMAGVEAEQGRAPRAALLLGAAQAGLDGIGSPLPPYLQREHDRTLEQTKAALGEAAFAARGAEGRTKKSLEEAVEYALKPEGAAAGE